MAASPAPQQTLAQSLLAQLRNSAHLFVAGSAVMLVALMIIPISPILLDLLLTINITLALTVMLTTLYIENAVAFSVFPTLVLLVTLFRLSLNITATRSILLHGYAGRMIEAFGN